MTARIVHNAYGKSRVNVMKLARGPGGDAVHDLTIDTSLSGDFDAAHVKGDNAAVLPTDTMKNTVYATARQHSIESIESLATAIGQQLLKSATAAETAVITVRQHQWNALDQAGRVVAGPLSKDHAFARGSAGQQMCIATVKRDSVRIQSGIEHLVAMKTAMSGFEGFLNDTYTTLKPTDDRIMATSITALWTYCEVPKDCAAVRAAVRAALLATFVQHDSKSVQHTLYAMGQAAIDASPAISVIHLTMPNIHYLLADLGPLGLDNPNVVFVPTQEPHGLIEATIERQ